MKKNGFAPYLDRHGGAERGPLARGRSLGKGHALVMRCAGDHLGLHELLDGVYVRRGHVSRHLALLVHADSTAHPLDLVIP